jgi:hypothetical protein
MRVLPSKRLYLMRVQEHEQAMAAFCLSVLVDGHSKGQEACLRPDLALLHKCLYKLQPGYTSDQLGVFFGSVFGRMAIVTCY